jgi:hypothetical protein
MLARLAAGEQQGQIKIFFLATKKIGVASE